jgi:DNA-binding CsgD family transcriptional regulator
LPVPCGKYAVGDVLVERLRHRYLQRLYHSVSALNSDPDPWSLSERTLEAVRTAVDCDFVTFDSFGDGGRFVDSRWNSDGSILTEELESEFGRLFNSNPNEHPLAHLLSGPPMRIEKFSDYVSVRDFKKTALYNEFFRRIGLLYQAAFVTHQDEEFQITCSLNRQKSDFSEGEKLLLNLLAPQLATAIRTSIELRRLNERQMSYDDALARVSRALIGVAGNGRVTHESGLAGHLIAKYFGIKEAGESLPKALSEWVSSALKCRKSGEMDIPVLIRRDGPSELRIEALNGDQSQELSVLLIERFDLQPAVLHELGLTSRESEILYWVAQGKNDDVIALLCNISVRTVNKHLEHIYRKLGVESRLSAITLTRELLDNYQ